MAQSSSKTLAVSHEEIPFPILCALDKRMPTRIGLALYAVSNADLQLQIYIQISLC